jgi:hypothetical protein
MGDTIWAAALFVPLMTLVLGLLGPLRHAIGQLAGSYAQTAAEREAKAALDLADAEKSRHVLAVRRGALAEETEREKARLAAETAQLETDAEAARRSLDAAAAARAKAIEARADADAALAPEAARKALEGSGEWLAGAYQAYCENYQYSEPLPFGRWIQGYDGAPRG